MPPHKNLPSLPHMKGLLRHSVVLIDAGMNRLLDLLGVRARSRIQHTFSLLRNPNRLRRRLASMLPRVVHAGDRATVRHSQLASHPIITKTVSDTPAGRAAFRNELLAQELFQAFPWKLPIRRTQELSIAMPRLPDHARLDRVAPKLTRETCLAIAAAALDAALDMHTAGYAHCDLNVKNMYFHEGTLLISDFETLTAYPVARRPPFPASYDVTGHGLESPHRTNNMAFASTSPASLQSTLGVDSIEALIAHKNRLRVALQDECQTFQSSAGRHTRRSHSAYCSFTTRHFSVPRTEAQRSAERRLEHFGLDHQAIAGKSVLDLGCNTGAMLFEISKYKPAFALGVEFDEAKVAVARRIASYCGLNQVSFRTADLDRMSAHDLGSQFDIVLCLAVAGHVTSPRHLYELLGRVTRSTLCFEGNSGTSIDESIRELRRAGFSQFEQLGYCDDDCRPENNVRPLLIAKRAEDSA